MKMEPIQLIKNNHLKNTAARVAILEFLQKNSEPVDVLEVMDYLKKKGLKTNLTTVYRVLDSFLTVGLVKKLELHEGKYRYELSSLRHHHHLVCQNCGKIEDIENCSLEGLEEKITNRSEFLIKYHSLEFYGLCRDCQKLS